MTIDGVRGLWDTESGDTNFAPDFFAGDSKRQHFLSLVYEYLSCITSNITSCRVIKYNRRLLAGGGDDE